jgi:transposase-like protein
MQEVPRRDAHDKYSWWCRECKGRKSIRTGSFFQKSNTTLQKWMLMLYLWARQYPVTDASEETGISLRVSIDMYLWFREVCSAKLLQNPIVLGGPGVIVQIDESLFRHKPKVCNNLQGDTL